MSQSQSQTESVVDRVITAATHLLLERGLRRIRTVDVANAASTSESTMFRHFDSLDAILAETYRRAWRRVNEVVAADAFNRPLTDDPIEVLRADMSAIWAMKADEESSKAALVAVLFMRRQGEILAEGWGDAADEQERFEARLSGIARSIVAKRLPAGRDPEKAALLLATLVLNYTATVWLTWYCMPVASDDVTDDEHNLSVDEADMGVLTLIDRVVSDTSVAVELAERFDVTVERDNGPSRPTESR